MYIYFVYFFLKKKKKREKQNVGEEEKRRNGEKKRRGGKKFKWYGQLHSEPGGLELREVMPHVSSGLPGGSSPNPNRRATQTTGDLKAFLFAPGRSPPKKKTPLRHKQNRSVQGHPIILGVKPIF